MAYSRISEKPIQAGIPPPPNAAACRWFTGMIPGTTMQINLQKPDHSNIIRGVSLSDQGGEIRVANSTYTSSVIVTPDTVELWDVDNFNALDQEHFTKLSGLGVEVVVLGTGPSLQFPDPGLTRSLVANQIGLEVMDTAAACRTYNILAADQRRVAAALILW